MAKPKTVANGSWRVSRDTWQTMPDLPFLMGVGGPPFRMTFTLSNDRVNRSRYLYPNNPDKRYVYEGDWILYIAGWIYLGKQND